jgi:hypothetical protein
LEPKSEKAVDRNGYKEFRTNQAVKGLPLRGAEGALDSLICSEKRWPLRSTATRAMRLQLVRPADQIYGSIDRRLLSARPRESGEPSGIGTSALALWIPAFAGMSGN